MHNTYFNSNKIKILHIEIYSSLSPSPPPHPTTTTTTITTYYDLSMNRVLCVSVGYV